MWDGKVVFVVIAAAMLAAVAGRIVAARIAAGCWR
jgi:hypothetical protein